MPPRIPPHFAITLDLLGLRASCYQPVNLFRPNGRKLPNCPEPGDPWEVFLRRVNGEFGIIGRGVGATLEDALAIAIKYRSHRGLLAAMATLGEQIDLLTDTLYACKD